MKRVFSLALFCAAAAAQTPPATPSASPPAAKPAPAPRLYAVRLTTGPAWDAAKSPNDQAGMREHSANIARLRREGLLVQGARFGDTGPLVLRVPDETAARTALAPDPTIAAGVFNVQIDVYSPFAHGTTAYLTSPEAVVVRSALAAYNTRDAAAVTAHYADDIAWFGVGADGKQSVEGEGRAALEKWLAGYFKQFPDVRAELSDFSQTGAHVSFRERVTWTAPDGTTRAQSALGVYEVRDGKVKRAWYFPATREPAPPAPKQP